MKLIATEIDWEHEAMKLENRGRRIYPPPDDGREWILLDEAAALFGIKLKSMRERAATLDFTRTCHKGVKPWYLKSEVMRHLAFLKMRERWYKRRRPQHYEPQIGHWEGLSDVEMAQFLWTTPQVAAFLGVSESSVRRLVKRGRIPVCLNRKLGKGGKNWYAPSWIREYKEDEERKKWLASHEKAKETMRAGIVEREVYKANKRPRLYKNLPSGWLTVREAADLLGISRASVRRLMKHGEIHTEHLIGAWDQARRPWFISRESLEAYIQTEHYQRTHRRGLEAVQKMIGRYVADDSLSPQNEKIRRDFPELASACSYDELMRNREQVTGMVHVPLIW